MNLNKISFPALVLVVVAAVGCAQQGESNPAGTASGEESAATASSAAVSHLTQADIRVIAPAPPTDAREPLYHKVGEDSVGAVTPMAGAEAFVALIGSGDHDVVPLQEGCRFTIEVEVKDEKNASAASAVIKVASNEKNGVMLPGSELEERRVTAHMAADAEDNYSCNLMLRKRL